ncbi:MAG TPA: hypothetical protein VK907_11965, partial [Phnomibacter sp.]|nr:hypothetical protein [Phnomibacter sp.]
MRSYLNVISVSVTLLFSGAIFAQSGTPTINVVTTAVPFLRIGPDARAGAMGDLGLTTAPDGNNIFWNLAKAPFSDKQGSL